MAFAAARTEVACQCGLETKPALGSKCQAWEKTIASGLKQLIQTRYMSPQPRRTKRACGHPVLVSFGCEILKILAFSIATSGHDEIRIQPFPIGRRRAISAAS
jgi:hypothetical protein